jgi:hypothetical protein
MKINSRLFWIGIVSLAVIAARGGSLDFVRQNLSLDISKTPFGSSLSNHPNPIKAFNDTGATNKPVVVWYKTEASSAYAAKHPKRFLEFGFSENRLMAIKVHVGSFYSDKGAQAKAQAELDDLFSKFQELAGNKRAFQDSDLRITYEALCNESENIVGRIIITLPENK